jgi:hypothetical protein
MTGLWVLARVSMPLAVGAPNLAATRCIIGMGLLHEDSKGRFLSPPRFYFPKGAFPSERTKIQCKGTPRCSKFGMQQWNRLA